MLDANVFSFDRANICSFCRKKALKNIEGKEENGGYQHIFLFPQYFLPYEGQF